MPSCVYVCLSVGVFLCLCLCVCASVCLKRVYKNRLCVCGCGFMCEYVWGVYNNDWMWSPVCVIMCSYVIGVCVYRVVCVCVLIAMPRFCIRCRLMALIIPFLHAWMQILHNMPFWSFRSYILKFSSFIIRAYKSATFTWILVFICALEPSVVQFPLAGFYYFQAMAMIFKHAGWHQNLSKESSGIYCFRVATWPLNSRTYC